LAAGGLDAVAVAVNVSGVSLSGHFSNALAKQEPERLR